jgi:hypothetical protein
VRRLTRQPGAKDLHTRGDTVAIVDLDHLLDGYRAMDERRAIKSLVGVSAI